MTPGIVWLTGCASGVGRHLTGAFLARGWRVMATDVDRGGLDAAMAEDGWPADRLLLAQLDVTDRDAWQTSYRLLLAQWGGLDVMGNVAGFIQPRWLLQTRREEVDRHMDINFGGVVNGSLIAARHMAERGRGHIINIASLAGIAPIPGLGNYSASKFAVRAWTLALARELKPLGVAVTVICPDAIETPMLTKQIDADEAALTFSGGKALTVGDIEKALFGPVLENQPEEYALPTSRALQARLAGAFPSLSRFVLDKLRRRGARIQKARRGEGA